MATFKGQTYQKYLLDVMAIYRQRTDLKAYLEILLSIVAVAIFILFAIKPTLITIGELITKVNSLQETSNQLDIKIKNLGTAQALYNTQTDKLALLDSAVPSNPDIGGYVRQLEGLVKKDNLTLVNMSADPVDLISSTPSGSLVTTVSASGSYEGLKTFLKDIETLRRPGIITKINLQKEEDTLTLTVTPSTPFAK